MKKLYVFIAIVLMAGIVQAGPPDIIGSRVIELYADTTGDTAQVTKITPVLAVMGFEYKDSISYWNPADSTDTTAHSQISWTSPQQVMIWTFGPITATPTLVDTTIGTVACSVSFASQTLGIEYDMNLCVDNTLENFYDSVVAIFNAKAALTDTVDAQDSGTYIKFVSLVGEGVLKEPWTMIMSSDSTDTASAADSVTLAMVCDSMVAAANASDTISDYMTAYDSSTFYIIQSDDAGLLFYYTFYNHADTHGVLAASQANVEGTTTLDSTYSIGITNDADVMDISVILSTVATADKAGGDDSAQIVLTSVSNQQTTTHQTTSCASTPCTLLYSIVGELADSTLLPELKIRAIAIDSFSQERVLLPYRLNWEVLLK